MPTLARIWEAILTGALLNVGAKPIRLGRLLHVLAATVSLLFVLVVVYSAPTYVPKISIEYAKVQAPWPVQPVIEFEGLQVGRPFASATNLTEDVDPVEWLMDSLEARFEKTISQAAEPLAYPNCTLHPERYEKTVLKPQSGHSSWRRDTRESVVAIALNLHNSEAVIPAQSRAILVAISFLLTHNKVYVSIYENGSKDKTKDLLSDFGAALQAIGVDGLWMHASRMLSNWAGQDRILMLSEIRNLALAPMMPYATNSAGEGTLVFINDVVTCASDILEVVHQQRLQNADLAMGMDWGAVTRKVREGEPGYIGEDQPEYDPDDLKETRITRLYDMWVARGINGDLVHPFLTPGGYTPFSENETWVIDSWSTQEEPIHKRWLNGLPFPTYAGWGGMAAFDASLFTRQHLRFRSSVFSGWNGGSSTGALGPWGRLVGSEGYLESDCPGASECEYIARDIWNLRHGQARIVMAPQVRVTYTVGDWEVMAENAPAKRREGADKPGIELISWSNVTIPETVVCISNRDTHGNVLDVWSPYNERRRLDPLWKPAGKAGAIV